MKSIDNFPKALKRIREDYTWSQEWLARKARIHVIAISHYECGRRRPSLANLIKLADALGCTIDSLLETKHYAQ